ncbi:esterase [Pseudomonas chlororaphis]|jgi:predicted alpha/beta superfamily hydrolase|uniref:Alpha/beta hydrolase-fold protein n=1 Tax=Pseudomonas morbosilactucae TaxID=2938197 RepID=A0A9X2C8R0_9PSED|nr:alpha/beta hydrolase-fold protein [Pseudomonas morbosilactucae]MCK9801020.1 alpha/beta hydrolase-fold protein [Pseudomonas morbosilactucae]MCK9813527.1 alpha/beta hydrolase-fold protein [Pseudomonas morbosilactucae]ROL69915.1 esterase [Pseudomonas chlororaphis]
MMRHLLMGLGAMLLGSFAAAQAEPVTLDGTEQWTMHSAEGREYRIMISLPEGEVPYTGGYPVIYLLDGNAYFPAFHAAKRAQDRLRASIIVAIGYPSDTPLDFVRRAFDLSPPVPQERNEPPQGGQDLFLEFIEKRLMPKVSERFKVDQDQRSLVGHSFGGMFGVYALFTRPALFQHVVAVSPSLWWRDRYLMEPERAFSQRARAGQVDLTHRSLTLLMGERDMVQEIQDARALQLRLQDLSQYGLRSDFQVEPGEDHMSVPFRVPTRVLDELISTRRF